MRRKIEGDGGIYSRADDCGQGVIASDSDSLDETPYDEETNDADGMGTTSHCLRKGGDDDDAKLDTI